MSRTHLFAVALLALATTTLVPAADVYTGPKPTTAVSALDSRTELERLQDQVDELAFFLAEAQFLIDAQQGQIKALQANQEFVDGLKNSISVTSKGLTIQALRITLDAARVDILADLTMASGELECESLVTESVDAESYTSGAGNIW